MRYINQVADEQQTICDSGVVGNARPCQGRDRGFEPRLSLTKSGIRMDAAFFVSDRHIIASQWSGKCR